MRQTTGALDGVSILPIDGLLVEFALAQNANAVVRGLRAVSDFEFEFQMALRNRSGPKPFALGGRTAFADLGSLGKPNNPAAAVADPKSG